MCARLRPHDPLQPHPIVSRLHHIGAIVQRQLILPGGVFRDHGFRFDPRLFRACIDVREQRQHPVQVIDGIDFRPVARAPVQHIRRRAHPPIRAARIGQQEELQLECPRREQPLAGHGIDLRLQRMARVRCHRRALKRIKRHQHLATRWHGAMQWLQRAGNGPGPQVAIPLIPDQPGFVHILAADIEAQDRDRQEPPRLVEGQQLVPPDDLAPPDPVGIVQHDIEGLYLGVGIKKGLRLGDGGARGARGLRGHVSPHPARTTGPMSRRTRRSAGRPVSSWSRG